MSPRWISWEEPAQGKTETFSVPDYAWYRSQPILELELFEKRLKPGVKLEDLSSEDAARTASALKKREAVVRRVAQKEAPTLEQRDMATPGGITPETLFAAWDAETLEFMVTSERAERKSGDDRRNAIRTSGLHLGYPKCCAEAFAGMPRQDDAEVVARLMKSTLSAEFHPLLNVFPPMVSPVSWYPCSLSCEASLKQGERWLKKLATDDQDVLYWRRDVLAGATMVFGRFTFLHFHGATRTSDGFEYTQISDALSFSAEPRLLESEVLQAFRSEVSSRLPHEGCLRVAGKTWHVEGREGAARGILLQPAHLLWFRAY